MKYIATSSLNIDNILSTESISPVSFYAKRNFGYRIFHTIPELPSEDSLILFSQIPSFEINDENYESYPMIIGIDDEEQVSDAKKVGEYHRCEIFSFDKTIHLTPVNCQILFFSEKDKVLSEQKCLDSKMNKLVDYYKIGTIQKTGIILSDLALSIKNISKPNSDICEIDNKFDKVKGFIYGYYFGAIKSVTPLNARMMTIQRRISDIVSSICNNNYSNNAFNTELDKLASELFTLERGDDTDERRKLWKNYAGQYGLSVDNLNEFLRSLKCEEVVKKCFCELNNIAMPQKISSLSIPGLVSYSDRLRDKVNSLVQTDMKEARSRFVFKQVFDVAPDFSNAMLEGTDNESMRFNEILNHIVWNNEDTGCDFTRLSTERLDQATNVTKVMKAMIEEKGGIWDSSPERKYLNHLRENIKDFKPFDINEIDDIVLQSLAAFILKGDDFDELVNYLEANAVPTEKYALSLWGATLGYVRIPRTLFSSYVDNVRFDEIYRSVYELLHRKELIGEIKFMSKNNMTILFQNVKNEVPETKVKARQRKVNRSKVETPTYLYDDEYAWERIVDHIPQNCQTKIKDDFLWFIGEMRQEPSFRKPYYQKINEKDNEKVIDSFCRLKYGKVDYFPTELRNKLRAVLLSIYEK